MRGALFLAFSLILAGTCSADAQAVASIADLSGLTIDELANLEITSVSRQPEPLSRAPAAVYVITADEIRRAGAVSLAEALRLAPNLQVARLDSGSYAITARGFNHNTATANKLQVRIDGRVVYTPLFSGVFWDEQDVPLADIDRIEVISGPGGALWGSNSVNGIINVITKSTGATQGALVDVIGGNLDNIATLRYGGKIGEETTFRIYGMGMQRGHLQTMTGAAAKDDWDKLQGGFRADWTRGADAVTIQGDMFKGTTEDQPSALQNGAISGANILSRWTRQVTDSSELQTQFYYSRTQRDVTSGITARYDSYDLDAQYSFDAPWGQRFVAGGGYRVTMDDFIRGPSTVFLDPAERTLRLANGFIQDQIALNDTLSLTLGLKAEHNSYTGLELMPDARLAWRVFDNDLVWGAISRAVRRPARFDRDLYNPGLFAGGPDFESENLIAYELGYRGQPTPAASFSISAFYNVYDDLRSVEASTPAIFPLVVRNSMEGETFGIALWGNYALTDWWRVSAGFNTLHKDLRLEPGSRDIFGVQFAGNDPTYQASLRSSMDLPHNVQLDVMLRAIDDLPSPRVPGYIEADVRIGWRITEALEFSVTGANLLHSRHTEFINPSVPAQEIPRSVTAGARWRF